jgi:MFS family permease
MPGFLLLKPTMRRLYQPYVDFLRLPDVGRLFLVAAIARMPISMTALAMTLFLRVTLGDFAQAGIVVGAYFVAIALVSPLLGRWIDRLGPRLPMLITGWLQPLLLTLVFVAAYQHWGYAIVLTAAIAAGLVPPPITTITRTLWRHRFQQEQERRMAYALDSVMTELNFTLGPSIVGLLAALTNAHVAMLVAIVCNFLAFLLFMRGRVLEHWQSSSHGERHWLGPLTDRRLVLYFCLGFGLTFCLGLFEVSYPAYALVFDSPALAGLLLALSGLGSALGGALFGTWQSGRSVEQQYALALSFLVLPFVLHALLPQLPVFVVVAFFGGLAIAPALTSLTLLTNRRAPALYATEALTWSATFIISGLGCGMGAAGYFIETWSLTTTFWIGAAVVGCMAVCAWGLQRGTWSEPAGVSHE